MENNEIVGVLSAQDSIVGTTAITEYLKGDKGDKGDRGPQGVPGEEGFSPVVSLTKEGHVSTLSITDEQGTQTVEILDGEAGGGGVWGYIEGTLSNQTDLQDALDLKADKTDIPTVPTKTSQLTNDSGFITKSVNNLDNYTKTSSLATVATTGDYDDLTDKPHIPTTTGELLNNSNFVSDGAYVHTDENYTSTEKTKLSGIAAGAEVNVQADWNESDSSSDAYILNKPTIPDVSGKVNTSDIVDDVVSTDTDKPLSANMGKALQDEIDNLKARGRFLALWNSATGLAMSNPEHSPYVYKTGDYFVIGAVDSTTNYKPNGSSYTIGVASSTVESAAIAVDDVYYYDGANWRLQVNTQKSVTFASISGQPSDNSNLASALNAKEAITNKVTSLSSSSTDTQYPSAKCVYDMIGDVESILTRLTTGSGV